MFCESHNFFLNTSEILANYISLMPKNNGQHIRVFLLVKRFLSFPFLFSSIGLFSLYTSKHILDTEGFQDRRHKNSKSRSQSNRNSAPCRQLNNNINEIFTLTKSQSSSFINFKVTLSDLEMCSDRWLFSPSLHVFVKKPATDILLHATYHFQT